jgi:hypothetical protein
MDDLTNRPMDEPPLRELTTWVAFGQTPEERQSRARRALGAANRVLDDFQLEDIHDAERALSDLYNLDPNPDRGDPDVPLALEAMNGRQVTIDDGETVESGTMVVVPGVFKHAAFLKREGERIVRCWRSGNLTVVEPPVDHGQTALVEITNEEGLARREEIRFPSFVRLIAAQRGEA